MHSISSHISSFFKKQSNRYIAYWSIYLLQGTLYAVGSPLSQLLILIILFISLKHFFYFIQKNNSTFIKAGILLTFLYTVYGLLLFILGGETIGISNRELAFDYIKSYYISVLPIYSFYYYAQKGELTADAFKIWAPVFLAVGIACFFRGQREALEFVRESGSLREDVTNNAGYVVLAVMPAMIAFRKTWVQMLGIAICFLFVLFSMKRGAILTASVALMIYIYDKQKGLRFIYKLLFIIATVIVGAVILHYLKETLFTNDFFVNRIEEALEGDTSGRDELTHTCIDYYMNNANIIQLVFGFGANGTIMAAGNYAHNDWVEMLLNQGILGISVFTFFWIGFFNLLRNKRLSKSSRMVLVMVFVIYFMRTMFSQSINDIPIFSSSVLGLAMCNGFLDIDKK